MSNPKMILVDKDEKYVYSLAVKFLVEQGDKIDLEVITDIEYLNEYFMELRQADILLISEELYFDEIQRHNIKNVLILTEGTEFEENIPEINKLYKYTSPNDIYSQVITCCNAMSDVSVNLSSSENTQIVTIYSPIGGVGKTTIAFGMCISLVQKHKKVLYVDAESMNTYHFFMKNAIPLSNNMVSEFKNEAEDLYKRVKHVIRNEKFDYLPPFPMSLDSLDLKFSIYINLLQSIIKYNEYDFVIIDTDVTFDSKKAELITISDKVIIVTEQSKSSVFKVMTLMRNMNCSDRNKYFFVCNKFDSMVENALVSGNDNIGFLVNDYIHNLKNRIKIDEDDYVNSLAKDTDILKLSLLVQL